MGPGSPVRSAVTEKRGHRTCDSAVTCRRSPAGPVDRTGRVEATGSRLRAPGRVVASSIGRVHRELAAHRGWIARTPDHQSTRETPVSELESASKLAATRDGWHRVAEHVLAAAQYADTGKIGLRPSPAGFATARPLRGGRQLRVAEAQLIVVDASGRRSAPHGRCGRPVRRRHTGDAGARLPTSDATGPR
jgi:hypothetical protein